MLSKNFSRLIATSITKYHAVTVCNNDAKMIKKKKKRISSFANELMFFIVTLN